MKSFALAFFLATSSLFAQKQITTSEYHSLAVTGNFKIELYNGPEGKIELFGNPEDLARVKVEVNDGILGISSETSARLKQVTLRIPIEDISAIQLNGSGSITSKETLNLKELKTALVGSGRIELAIRAIQVANHLNGSGTIQLSGQIDQIQNLLVGSGHIDTLEASAQKATLNVIGSGKIASSAQDEAKISINGSGKIHFAGSGIIREQHILGTGKVVIL